jgi:hypothetical protein
MENFPGGAIEEAMRLTRRQDLAEATRVGKAKETHGKRESKRKEAARNNRTKKRMRHTPRQKEKQPNEAKINSK